MSYPIELEEQESEIDDVNYDGSIKEEKAFLVNAAKQFKETIIETKKLNRLLPQISSS
jgi:hypothetical protein